MLDIMDKKARRHFRHWKRLKPLLTALRGVLLILCILAKPSWCIELGSAIDVNMKFNNYNRLNVKKVQMELFTTKVFCLFYKLKILDYRLLY